MKLGSRKYILRSFAKRATGFTLLEVLVAMSVAAVLSGFAIAIIRTSLDNWSEVSAKRAQNVDASLALEFLQHDIESAIFAEGRGDMFAVTALKSSSMTGDSSEAVYDQWLDATVNARLESDHFDPVNGVYGWGGSWLRFFTEDYGVNAVSYQIVRRYPMATSNVPMYMLFRSTVSMDNVLDEGFDFLDTSSDYYLGGSSVLSSAGSIRDPNQSSVLSSNVVDFGVRLYIRDASAPETSYVPNGLRLVYPANSSNAISTSDETHFASLLDGTSYGQRFPELVEVFIRILDAEGSELLLSHEDDGGIEIWREIVDAHSVEYSRLIEVGVGL